MDRITITITIDDDDLPATVGALAAARRTPALIPEPALATIRLSPLPCVRRISRPQGRDRT